MSDPSAVPDKLQRHHRGKPKQQPDGSVAPFPLERYAKFKSVVTIRTKDSGVVPYESLGTQRYLIEQIADGLANGITTFIVLKARGGGISTELLLLDVFWGSEYPGTQGAIITHNEEARDLFRSNIEVFQLSLPKRFRVNTPTKNRLLMIFENLSLFRFLIAGMKTTTNKLGRSGHSNFVHGTEVAFWGSADDIKALMQSLSELHPNRLYVFESTANGVNNPFTEMWETALSSPAQRAIFIGWWLDERNEFGEQHPLYPKYMPQGRQTPLTTLERKRVREVKAQHAFEITSGQIAWYRYHLENKCGGDQSTMDQEMPWTAEMAFVSTGAQFFSNESLTDQMREAKKFPCMPFAFRLTKRWEEIQLIPTSIDRAQFKIWEKPSRFGFYAIGHDPAYGLQHSRDPDAAAISVLRCFADRCYQVAEFRSASVETYQQAWILAFIAGLYGQVDAMVNLELNGPGAAVFQELEKLREYIAEMPVTADADLRNCLAHMRHFLYRRPDSMTGGLVKQWRSTAEIRDNLLTRFKDGVSLGLVHVRSLQTLEECRRVEEDEDGYIGAAGSYHDDGVSGTALAYYAWAEWMRPKLKARGMTAEHAQKVEQAGGEDPVDGLVRRFLNGAKIRADRL